MNIVVLGAGIAGLSYAANCKEKVIVYEKNNYVGGLCHSFSKEGFKFDSAVHLSFTSNDEARAYFDQTEYTKKTPDAFCYYKGLYVKHPVIENLYPFDASFKSKCIEDFVSRDTETSPVLYSEWLEASYGREMKEKFYDVYTKKYWTVTSDSMSTSWVGIRLQKPDLHKILLGAFTDRTENSYYAKEMRYPVEGGYEAFLKPLINKTNVICGKEVIRISPDTQTVFFSDGTKQMYDKLVSSIPLPLLANITVGVPERIKKIANRLVWTKVSIVTLGFNKSDVPKHLWMYIYDEDIFAARVNSPSLKSLDNVPNGCSSLQFEIYHRNSEKVNEESVIQNTLAAITKMKIAEEKDICFCDYRLLPYGNVIFYEGMEQDREEVKRYIEKLGITLIGRFGEWDYLWSDQSYLSGKNAANQNEYVK